MKRKQGTTLEFECKKNEIVTISITERNTEFLFSYSPHAAYITKTGKTLIIDVGSSSKTVTLTFDFNDNGGSYEQILKGSEDPDTFTRTVRQPTDNLPEDRTYVFHVS